MRGFSFILLMFALSLRAAYAQTDPQDVMDRLIRERWAKMQRDQQERQIMTAERARLATVPDGEIGRELMSYCPQMQPPCIAQPPDALLDEALRRGIIVGQRPAPGSDCMFFGDGMGGGIGDCR